MRTISGWVICEPFLDSISGSGWLLHLNSLKSIKSHKTAYLARPGFPALIEVHEKKKLMDGPDFVEGISIMFDSELGRLLTPIGFDHILKRSAEDSYLTISGHRIAFKKLI